MRTITLGEVATYINGKAFKPSEWSSSGKPIIRIQNLTDPNKEFNYYEGSCDKRYHVKKGDILISWSASLGLFEWTADDAYLNQHIFKVKFDKVEIDKNYFKYMVSEVLTKVENHIHGSTMKHITKKRFDSLQIPYPPLEIQKKIAEVLDKADAIRQRNRLILQKYDQLAQSVFLDMFGDPVSNPKGWKQSKLGNVGRLDRGVSKHRPRNAPELLGGLYPLIQTGDVANSGGYITDFSSTYSEIGLKQSKLWPKGTLCITIAATIAKTGILTFDACFPDSVVGFVPKETNNVFVMFWFSFFQKIIEEKAPTVAQKNINLKILRDLEIISPPITLQNEFLDFYEKLEIQKSKQLIEMDKSEELFQSLLQRAFKGELFTQQQEKMKV